MPKVLQLYNVFGATTERTMLEVPLALAERGHDLTFASESVDSDAPQIEQPLFEIERVYVEPVDDINAQMQAIAQPPPAIDGRFDLVHGHFGPRCLHAARYLHRGVPVVITTYGYDVSRLLTDPCWAERYRWMGRHGATFVALSEAMAATLRGAGVPDERIEVIPLGIDVSRWMYRPSEASARFLFVGRFVSKKGVVHAIHALSKLRERGVEAELRVVGSGSRLQDGALREQAKRLGIEAFVDFAGRIAYDELADVMRQAAALVAPSQVAPDGDAEGCPMVLMQAQAVGTPVITTRHAGNPEALPSEAARFVVEEGDTDDLASAMYAMRSLLPVERASLQAAGRAWIESRFDIRLTVQQYDALYRRLTGIG